jgi:hypothetical protein
MKNLILGTVIALGLTSAACSKTGFAPVKTTQQSEAAAAAPVESVVYVDDNDDHDVVPFETVCTVYEKSNTTGTVARLILSNGCTSGQNITYRLLTNGALNTGKFSGVEYLGAYSGGTLFLANYESLMNERITAEILVNSVWVATPLITVPDQPAATTQCSVKISTHTGRTTLKLTSGCGVGQGAGVAINGQYLGYSLDGLTSVLRFPYSSLSVAELYRGGTGKSKRVAFPPEGRSFTLNIADY